MSLVEIQGLKWPKVSDKLAYRNSSILPSLGQRGSKYDRKANKFFKALSLDTKRHGVVFPSTHSACRPTRLTWNSLNLRL